jgi:DNA-binding GntR family transcriptional regulator
MIVTHGITRARQEHRRLVELCAARNIDEAIPYLNDHITRAGADLVATLADTRVPSVR